MDSKYLPVLQNAYLALLRLSSEDGCIKVQCELKQLRDSISEITGDTIEKVQNDFEFLMMDERIMMYMENKIHICNWLLTRKCNLRCAYCAITKNYKNKPHEYPDMKHYHKNEMNTEYIIDGLKKLKIHNPEMFHIFYGGEPFLRSDLPDLINFCNDENIHYTIITNNTPEIQGSIELFLLKVDYVQGLTSSVDPIYEDTSNDDRVKKSIFGMERLISLKPYIKDLVAELTADGNNIQYLYNTVKELSNHKINTDITFLDISKSPYYDFSNIYDGDLLVRQTPELKKQLKMIEDEKLDAHMMGSLMKKVYNNLPSNYDCKLQKNIHNITVDADGTLRLCLRIRGVSTPNNIKLNDGLFTKQMEITQIFKQTITKDKKNYCRLCQWSCPMMSELISQGKANINELAHLDKRNT